MVEIIVKSNLEKPLVHQKDVASLVWECLEKYKDKECLIHSITGEVYTYAQLKTKAENVASHLLDYGVKPGDIVIIYSTNCLEYIVFLLAAWRIGGTCALLNAMAVAHDVTREINRLKSKIMFTNDINSKNAVSGAATAKYIKTIISLGERPGCIPYSALVTSPSKTRLPDIESFKINPVDDVAVILFSSGTTGPPKAVQITHRNLATVFATHIHPAFKYIESVNLCFQPLAHIFGLGIFVNSIIAGATTIIISQFTIDGFLGLVWKHKVHTLALVPPVAVALCKSGLLPKYDLSSVRMVICGAAPLSADIQAEMKAQMGEYIMFGQGYGLTETCGLFTGTPHYAWKSAPKPKKPGSVGMLIPFAEAKVIDQETGKSLGPDCEGEILSRGPLVMKGYLGDPGSTAATLDSDGWIHTGDLGYYDENGYFYIVDRLKELIKYNALQVSPSELESLILTHPAVADVGVVGRPDPAAGELPAAWVVTKPGHTNTAEDIEQWVAERVAPYKKLRGGVKLVPMIPKSPSGKILRKDMVAAMVKEAGQAKL